MKFCLRNLSLSCKKTDSSGIILPSIGISHITNFANICQFVSRSNFRVQSRARTHAHSQRRDITSLLSLNDINNAANITETSVTVITIHRMERKAKSNFENSHVSNIFQRTHNVQSNSSMYQRSATVTES